MDKPETTPAEKTETPADTTPERLTKPAKPKPAKPKPAKGDPATALAGGEEAEAEALGLPPDADLRPLFLVSCPKDPCLPPRTVRGLTAADAKERYCEEMGIITVGHPLQAVPVGE